MSAEQEPPHDPVAETLELDAVPAKFDPRATLEPTLAPRFRRGRSAPRGPRPGSAVDAAGETTIRLKEKIADGGMGRVFLAEQVALHREVAVKTLRDEFLDEQFADRLVREARVTGLVEHPNIVPVYALKTDDRGAPQMVMRRIDGVSFRTLLRDKNHPLLRRDATEPIERCLNVLTSVCDALSFAHSRGVVHLDVKPDNIMVGEFNDVYLVDWGVACSLREEHRGVLPMVDETTEVLGTPAYLAPEVIDRSLGQVGTATDVFLLGATLYEILAGKPPYGGEDLRAILNQAFLARPAELPESAPKELAAVVRRAMNAKPAERYASVEAFRAAIVRHLRHRQSTQKSDLGFAELDRLRPQIDDFAAMEPAAVERLIRKAAECRFFFAQALREWPENAAALEGMTEVTLLLAEVHLRREDHASARALVVELTDPAPRLEGRLAEVIAEVERAEAEAMGHREQRDQMDERRSRRARAIYVFGIIGVIVLPMFVGVGLENAGLYSWRTWHSIAYAAVTMVIGLAGALAMRESLMPNRVARRYIIAFGVLGAAVLVRRGLALLMGYREFADIAMDLYLFGAGAGVIGVFMDRRFITVAVATVPTAFLIALFPKYGLLLAAISALLGPGTMAAMWLVSDVRDARRSSKSRSARPPSRPPTP